MKAAITYRRVSTDKQAEKYSLPAQKRINQETAQKLECVIVKEYEDAGCSAGSLDTMPALRELLHELDDIQPQVLIVTDIDRLGRGYDFFLVLKELIAHEVLIYTEAGQESELVTGFRALIGVEERNALKRRIRRGKEEAARAGRPAGGQVVYGYRRQEGSLVIEEKEQKVLELIFDWLVKGHGFIWIAKALNSRGYRTRGGYLWEPWTICRLTQNRTLVGAVRYRDRWYGGHHEPVISSQIFEEAQKLIQGRKMEGVDLSSKYLLSGFGFCGLCGSRLKIAYKERGKSIYRCRRSLFTTCQGVYINREFLEQITIQAFFARTADCKFELLGDEGNKTSDIVRVKQELAKLSSLINVLMSDYYERGLLRRSDYEKKYRELTQRQEDQEKELAELSWQSSKEREKMMAEVVQTDIASQWKFMELEEKRQVLKLFVDKIVVYSDPRRILKEKRIRIIWK